MSSVTALMAVFLNGIAFQLIAPKLSDIGLDYLQAIYQKVGWSNTKKKENREETGNGTQAAMRVIDAIKSKLQCFDTPLLPA